ncbi:flippase [Mangrovimicrobium sediminis]|uniref:Flippase n=1 Tax=Mangrovimicrobium sediminis TaxID=2562682 RepID=A0A4Z0M0V1_9GAMM|nr:flippase [Haliea sp. SAOS-164]TGD73110.1 flippase [Haliea sp. SAOS-164]
MNPPPAEPRWLQRLPPVLRRLWPASDTERRASWTLAGSFLIRVSNLGLRFGVAVLLARLLGPEEYGGYSFALAVIMVLAIPVQLGLPRLVERETARAQAQANWGLIRLLWGWAFRVILGFSVLLSLACLLLLYLAPQLLPPGAAALVAPGLLLVPLFALGAVRAAALRGLRRVISGQLPDAVVLPLVLLAALLVLTAFGSLNARDAMLAHVAAAAVAFVLGALLLHRARPGELRQATTADTRPAGWLGAAFTLALVAGLQLVNNQADILMLGYLRSSAEVGVYRVAASAAVLTLLGLQVVNTVISPWITRLYTQDRRAELCSLVTRASRIIFAISLPVALVFMVWAEPLLEFCFGEPYRSGATALRLLTLAQVVNFLAGPVGNLLTMSGHERVTLLGVIVATVVNVLLNLLFIPRYGVEGAALASALSIVTWNTLLWWQTRRVLGIDASPAGWHTR